MLDAYLKQRQRQTSMLSANSETMRLIESVGSRTRSYLLHEGRIATQNMMLQFQDVSQLKLQHLTSIMSVEGPLDVLFAFSFDETLARKIMLEYTAELSVEPADIESYTEETVADLINIVLGNALGDFNLSGEAIKVSPPIVISGAKNIHKSRPAQFLTAELKTDHGELQIHCIGPRELFDPELNFIGSK